MAAVNVESGEMVTARELARDYPRLMKRLRDGKVKKLVVMRLGEIESVVLSVDEYEKLAKK